MFKSRQYIKKLTSFSLITLLLIAQLAFAAVPFIPLQVLEAAAACVEDTAGANDEPGQKDLTQLCAEASPPVGTKQVTWNWDELGTSGSNTLDACALFDTDNDGKANYAICVTTTDENPAVMTVDSPRVYSCGDDKADRCTSTNTLLTGTSSSCTVTQLPTQPFGTGAGTPNDTVASCTLVLADVGGLAAKLVDVCSFPSQEPGSDPSDCVIARANAGKLEVIKNLVPASSLGVFDLQIDGVTKATNVGNNGTTNENVVTAGSHTVGEIAGTSTSLSSYSTNIICRDLNGSGAIIAQGSATTLQVNVADESDVVCIITNTAAGSITIVKDAKPNRAQDFSFTTTGTGLPANFLLDDDANADLPNQRVFNNLSAGTYTVTEADVAGWDLKTLICSGGTTQNNGSTVTVTLGAGQNITCTFTNVKRATITVNKVTVPTNVSSTVFPITLTGTGAIHGPATGNLTTAQPITFSVSEGSFSVSEQLPAGWVQTGNTCNTTNLNVVVFNSSTDANLALTCTITNTQLAVLKFVKDALPNHEQNFVFTDVNLPGDGFTLDDDADPALGNEKIYADLSPGVTYSVTEQSLAGWQLTGLNCNQGSFNVNGSTVNVAPTAGQTITCTFQNTKLGLIGGVKQIVNSDGTVVGTGAGWVINLFLNGNQVGQTATGSNGSYSFTDLLPGSYTLTETLLAGYTQIFGAAPVTLAAGQESTSNNFGNFQNGSIGGFKWNDLNGNALYDNEPKLGDWTMTLYNDGSDADTDLDDLVTSTVTDVVNGSYSFASLAPGRYAVCETQQSNWVQTFPAGNLCHEVLINESGETNSNTNFGNQGRGTIRVIKNVDSDGNGSVDFPNVTNWNWNINGSGNFTTGSENSQPVAAGSYTVSEQQKNNFHVVSVVCDTQVNAVATSAQIVVAPGANVTCTFVNARDVGTLTLIKTVVNDNGGSAQAGNFTLHVKQGSVEVVNSPAAGSAAGTIYNLPTGTYSVSEDAPVTGYQQTSIICDGQTTDQITLTTGTNKTCTITNNDIPPQLTVVKHVENNNSGTLTASDFTMNVTGTNVAPAASFPGSETGTTVSLNAGAYSVGETAVADYTASLSADCAGTIALGQTKTCTITNTDNPHPGINIVKTGPATAHEGGTVTYTFTVTNTGDTILSGVTVVDSITGNANYLSGDTNSNGLLEETETWIFTTQYTIPIGQISNVVNTATVCADDSDQTEVCDNDDHELDVLHPDILVVKSGPPLAYEGTIVGYNFTVTNTGDTTLLNVGISDDIATNETCLANVLAPGAFTTCSAIYLVPLSTSGDVTNIVTASGTDPLGEVVTDIDDHTLDIIHPAIHIEKTGPATAHEGDTVTYTFTVTNIGDIPLSNNTVSDSIAGTAVYQSGDTNTNALLDTTETWIFSAQLTIPTPQSANIINVGTVCADDPLQTEVCDEDNHELDVLHPSLTVEKSGPATAYEGNLITYNFTITNNGDTTLTNVGISDDIATNETCLANVLAPGAFTTCTAIFTIPSPQVADVTNLVTACGLDALQLQVCDTDNHTLDVLHPTITVNKVVAPSQGDGGLFNLLVDGQVKASDINHGGTTGLVNVTPGTHNIAETAGTATNLLDYLSSFSENCLGGVVNVTGDENVTCVITNTRLGSITIVKNVQPDSAQEFSYNSNLTSNNGGNFGLTDDGVNTALASQTFTGLIPGEYNAAEAAGLVGWDLDDINCDGGANVSTSALGVAINLLPGENVTCTFINLQRANVTVTKYNDLNRNGQYDPGEVGLPETALPGWTITLDGAEQITGITGTTTFSNVIPNQLHTLDEVQQTGWHLSDITCDADFNEELLFSERLAQSLNSVDIASLDGHMILPGPGQTVNCFVGNYSDVVLDITKTNNRPNPTTVGDTVTYSLFVSVPEVSGVSFGTNAIDLPPENFKYVPGSWTAFSNVRGDLKVAGITTEPTYASPGTWILGTMIPGEIVILTYRAVIGNIITPGKYPDVAFAHGCGMPSTVCANDEVVLSNLTRANEPFVSTAVAILAPQVLGASTTVLVDTGTPAMFIYVSSAIILIVITLFVARRRPITKGGLK